VTRLLPSSSELETLRDSQRAAEALEAARDESRTTRRRQENLDLVADFLDKAGQLGVRPTLRSWTEGNVGWPEASEPRSEWVYPIPLLGDLAAESNAWLQIVEIPVSEGAGDRVESSYRPLDQLPELEWVNPDELYAALVAILTGERG
jgi:hypothetical protein